MQSDRPPSLFDPARRSLTMARGTMAGGRDDIVGATMAESLIDRLSMVTRSFATPLLIGARRPELVAAIRAIGPAARVIDPCPPVAARRGADPVPEDALLTAVAEGAHDLVVWAGGMESIDDVPGALVQMRRALRPDGLLLGALVGDGSWTSLRTSLARADGATGVPRFHPQIDVRAVGDLMARAGLVMPVIDVEELALSYRALSDAVGDLRAAGLGRCLTVPTRPIDRLGLAIASEAFAASGSEGRTLERVRIIHFLGWSPGPDQPRPARRGSAGARLSDALRPDAPVIPGQAPEGGDGER